jgi:hypothetical protein
VSPPSARCPPSFPPSELGELDWTRAWLRQKRIQRIQSVERSEDADEQGQRAGVARLQALKRTARDPGPLRQVSLRDVSIEALTLNSAPDLVEDGALAHGREVHAMSVARIESNVK